MCLGLFVADVCGRIFRTILLILVVWLNFCGPLGVCVCLLWRPGFLFLVTWSFGGLVSLSFLRCGPSCKMHCLAAGGRGGRPFLPHRCRRWKQGTGSQKQLASEA